MKNRVLSLLGLVVLASVALTSPTLADKRVKPLSVGDLAPAISVAKWVKGTPIKKFEAGKIYVVEFWATWCGPCKQSIPHLTELQKKFKDKVKFTGVSVFEERNPTDESYIPKVASFVDKMGAKMDYTVAVDGKEGVMGKTWMDAANQNGIPTAFVIGKDRKIAWIGHPMMDMERVLDEVVADKFDIAAEAKKQAQAELDAKKRRAMMEPLNSALRSNRYADAIKEIDKIVEAQPAMEENLLILKYQLLLRTDEPTAYKLAKELAANKYSSKAMALNQLAWFIVDDRLKLKNPDFELAVSIAQQAVELTKGEDAMVLDTLGLALFKKGDVAKAIEVQTKAVTLSAHDSNLPDATKEEIAERLKLFKSKKKDSI